MRKRTLAEVAQTRTVAVLKIAVCIVLDALLFVVWVAIVWASSHVAEYFAAKGVAAWATHVFEAVSQIGTLIATLIFVVRDIVDEVMEAISHSDVDERYQATKDFHDG